MQHDEAHPLVNAFQDFRHDVVAHLGVGAMAPPDQHVGGLNDFVGEAVLRFVERGEPDVEVIGRDAPGDGGMKPFGVNRLDSFILLFVTEFIPDCDIDLTHRKLLDFC